MDTGSGQKALGLAEAARRAVKDSLLRGSDLRILRAAETPEGLAELDPSAQRRLRGFTPKYCENLRSWALNRAAADEAAAASAAIAAAARAEREKHDWIFQ